MFPVEAFRDTLAKAAAIFERHSIRFHLTGGLTSVLYGEPRMTQDIDLVIDNRAVADQMESFISSLEQSDFLSDTMAIRHAVDQRGMFQIFDNVESLKLDIYPRTLIDGELDRSEWIDIFENLRLPVASRADAAASKLVWINKGSAKSRRDLRHIYRTSADVDRELIHELAKKLELEPLLAEVLQEPNEIRD